MSHLALSQKVEKGLEIGNALPVEVVADNGDYVGDDSMDDKSGTVFIVSTHEGEVQRRKAEFRQLLNGGMINSNLSTKDCQQALSFLEEFHGVFSLAEGERGETNLVEPGDA